MTIAELVCELLYAGKTLKEIARYDSAFMRHVLCRARDEYGNLIRRNPNLPWWVTTDSKGQWVIKPESRQSYTKMFDEIMKRRGMDERQRRIAWAAWKAENPGFGRHGGD